MTRSTVSTSGESLMAGIVASDLWRPPVEVSRYRKPVVEPRSPDGDGRADGPDRFDGTPQYDLCTFASNGSQCQSRAVHNLTTGDTGT